MRHRTHVDEMEQMFAAVSELYAQFWNEFFHFAIFENEVEDLELALQRTNRQHADALRIDSAANALDLACGRGGFADFLAQNTAGQVLGIDISKAQLRHCRRFRRPNLSFKRHDVMRIDELGERFEAVSLLDADCYLPDKELAIEKIAAVTKPGGRFLLLSWCKQEGLNRLQEELVLQPLMRCWAIPHLETARRYKAFLTRADWRILEAIDLTDRVRPNWQFAYDQAIHAVQELSIGRAASLVWKRATLDPEGIRILKEQFPAALYVKAGFDAGFLRYMYFLAEKK